MTTWVCGLAPRTNHDSDDENEVQALVAAVQAGDREAFGELYRRYFGLVFGWLRHRLDNETDAEDLAQEVFLRLQSTIGTYQLREGSPFKAWLTGGLGKMVLAIHGKRRWADQRGIDSEKDAIRRGARDEAVDPPGLGAVVSSPVAEALERLPATQRQCVVLRHVDGLPVATTAAVIQRANITVEQNCARGLKQLRVELAALAPVSRQPGPPPGTVLFTVAEIAARTGRCKESITGAIRDQRLTGYWIDRRWQVPAEALEAFLATAKPSRPGVGGRRRAVCHQQKSPVGASRTGGRPAKNRRPVRALHNPANEKGELQHV